MIRRATLLAAATLLLAAPGALGPAAAGAAPPAPAWELVAIPLPSNFTPGAKGTTTYGPEYFIVATNVGETATSGPIALSAELPAGLTPVKAFVSPTDSDPDSANPTCTTLAQTVTCETTGPLHPGRFLGVKIPVDVSASPGVLSVEASVSGGGAAEAKATAPTPISPDPVPFDFLPGPSGFSAPLTNADGSAATQAGSHPSQFTVNLAFPVERAGEFLTGTGHLHAQRSDLPRGVIVNPTATAELCTEAQLVSLAGCPEDTQVGTAAVMTATPGPTVNSEPLYNMVPPYGTPAELAFDAVGVGIFTHIIGGVRSDGDYGLQATTSDIISYPGNPVFSAQVQLWGDPTGEGHDQMRGKCNHAGGSCPVAEPEQSALLAMPSQCTGPIAHAAAADSWEQIGAFKEASYESADLEGSPVGVEGCNQLSFEPTIEATPTTNLADSPSGLDFDLHQPQEFDLDGLSTAALKDASVTLPKGMAVNPSSAQGQEACSPEQIGLATGVGEAPIHFTKDPDQCPDAAKIGTLEVTTPLLAQTDESGTKILRDPEGKVLPRPLEGSVYLAEPFENPFGSLIAIYFSIDDPQSGTVAKLAGRVEPDPQTGQLRTRFEENPQLPLQDVRLHLFAGPRASLITPLTCATHTTTSELTPWSAPEGEDAHPTDSFATTGAPGGGPCPSVESQAPNAPAFSAGTISPQAGAYSPFVLTLSRQDGSQRLAGIDTTLPPGLSGKLAGIATCSEAQIAQALARSHPNEGTLEQQSPSCPSSSEVGTVDVAVGAGPTPLHTTGHAYLAGPYKGAPLSLLVITPAVAGPFDLGAVTVRTALYLDPASARIHAVSDPLPAIIEGIPLDVRSVVLKMGRPEFTLNPTSCDPMAITGAVTSTLGQSATLSSPFQVGGCQALPFKPKLSLKLKGGTKRGAHPKLIATLAAKPGEANIAATSVQLPRSAFLDQAHIRTVCTRVQFAADTCPKGSVYGKASATTPLLDYPLTGNVYLRSSDNELPDLLIDLRGPDYQPLRIELAGRTDSVKGALRNTFDLVPDAPVSKFHLELFGGKRGLVINSRDLCAHVYRATVQMDGQNGKVHDSNPVVRNSCKKHR